MENREVLDVYEPSPLVWDKLNIKMKKTPPKGINGSSASWKWPLIVTLPIAITMTYFMLNNPVEQEETQVSIPVVEEIQAPEVEQHSLVVDSIEQDMELVEEEVKDNDEVAKIELKTEISQTNTAVILPEEEVEIDTIQYSKKVKIDSGLISRPSNSRIPIIKTNDPQPDFTESLPIKSSRKPQRKNEIQYSIDTLFDGITKLIVHGAFCDVKVNESNRKDLSLKGSIRVEAKGVHSKLKDRYSVRCQRDGNQLSVSVYSGKSAVVMVGSLTIDAVLFFDVPPGLQEIIVKNSSGDVDLNKFKGEKLHLVSSSGDISATDIFSTTKLVSSSGDMKVNRLEGNLTTTSSSGNQDINDIQGNSKSISSSGNISINGNQGNLTLRTASGNILLQDLQGNVNAESSSGDYELKNINGNCEMRSSSGQFNCKFVEGDMNIQSSSGDITVMNSQGNYSVTTSSGYFRGSEIEVNAKLGFTSNSGDLDVELTNSIEALSFDLTTGSGDLKVSKGEVVKSEENFLKIEKGEVWIKATTSSGNQTFR